VEELTELSQLFRSHNWQLWLKCLHSLQEKLSDEVWRMDTEWDKYTVLRAQMNLLNRIVKIPTEVEQLREAKNEEMKRTKGVQ